ncbi:hypothetical protein LSUE1_G008741 [Lachnellula suecica]|uniref:Uncharacterized protein n=1 Tax=Lachnellula suecica TaxID=602035 RepID=A0A8T9BUL9_9HELO|nr:hypothetical protein LSUE1_G008741 [Lachnellula suecica]
MVKYDRDTAVAAIASFYEFFCTLPTSTPTVIQYPPPGGWPDITPENMAAMKKSDSVIDLYRHLPYPKGHIEIAHATSPTWWFYEPLKPAFDEPGFLDRTGPIGAGEIPADVAILTNGGRNGSWLLLDTTNGTITNWIQQENPEHDEPSQDSPDAWRAYPTLPISMFFESWKNEFRSLAWMVVPKPDDDSIFDYERDPAAKELRTIYRAHGWGTEQWRAVECKEALFAWDKEQMQKMDEMDDTEESSRDEKKFQN